MACLKLPGSCKRRAEMSVFSTVKVDDSAIVVFYSQYVRVRNLLKRCFRVFSDNVALIRKVVIHKARFFVWVLRWHFFENLACRAMVWF